MSHNVLQDALSAMPGGHTSMTEKAPCHTSVDDDDLVYAFTVQQVTSLAVNVRFVHIALSVSINNG